MPTRRHFLQQTTALAGLAATARADDAKSEPLLPTVKLGPHAVTRLIVGGNPVYGYSHFNRHLSQHMTDWHTPERVVELLKRCERADIRRTYSFRRVARCRPSRCLCCLFTPIQRVLLTLVTMAMQVLVTDDVLLSVIDDDMRDLLELFGGPLREMIPGTGLPVVDRPL